MRNYSLTTLSRPLVGLVSTVLIVLALSACRKELGPPSEEYEQARQRFSKIYGQKLDEAFLDPEMDAIESLLQQVPADSMDAQSAKELQQRIKDGRAKMEKARQEREAAIAAVRQGNASVPSGPSSLEAAATPPAPQESRDAGPNTQGPVAGSSASELVAGYLGCFQRSSPITVKDRGQRETWEMADRARCNQVYPSFVGQVVLIEDGKVLTVLPKSAVQVTYQTVDAGPTTGGNPPAP